MLTKVNGRQYYGGICPTVTIQSVSPWARIVVENARLDLTNTVTVRIITTKIDHKKTETF
jgi:hypothetical protein